MENSMIKVGGMSCGGCVKNVSAALLALDGVASAEVSLEQGQASVSFDPARVSRPALVQAIEDLGFDAA
jgi:copper chaperone